MSVAGGAAWWTVVTGVAVAAAVQQPDGRGEWPARFRQELLGRVGGIDRDQLCPEDQVNLDIFSVQIQSKIASFGYRSHLIPILADSGFHTRFARLSENMPLVTVRDFENYISRMQAFPLYMKEHIELMREGLRTGLTQPQVILEGYEGPIQAQVVENPEESVFYAPFQNLPTAVPKAQYERLRNLGKQAIRGSIVPAYAKFLAFMVDEYRPGARTTLGASELPEGRAYYAHLIRHFTTLDLTADQIHQIGLKEVARIREEMDELDEPGGDRRSEAVQGNNITLKQDRGNASTYTHKRLKRDRRNVCARLCRQLGGCCDSQSRRHSSDPTRNDWLFRWLKK